jgi:hypothetical protein
MDSALLAKALRRLVRQEIVDDAQPPGIVFAERARPRPQRVASFGEGPRVPGTDVCVPLIDKCDALWRPVVVGAIALQSGDVDPRSLAHPATLPQGYHTASKEQGNANHS